MAAGLGFKEFTTGDVLTAADANGFLASQVVMVFDDAAARATAITSPQEGMITYLKDTNAVEKFDGAAFVAVAGGSSPLTTKGDLYTFSTVDARLAVGANGTVLLADSAEATGLKWATPTGSTASYTLLASATLTGASTITISGLSGHNNLFVTVRNGTCSTASSFITFKFNSAPTNHNAFGFNINTQSQNPMSFTVINTANTGSVAFARTSVNFGSFVCGTIQIFGANTTAVKPFLMTGAGENVTSDAQMNLGGGFFDAAAVISTFSLISSAGNFSGGNLSVFGSVA